VSEAVKVGSSNLITGQFPSARVDAWSFRHLFTTDKPVIFNFHVYPVAVKQLLFDRPAFPQFQINGYIEEGTTTTPFDLCVQNLASRYHVVMQAVRAVAGFNAEVDRAFARQSTDTGFS
jgi:xylulose-5-phosphate/fructose-6-phosphate phosphoketolase